MGARKSFDRAVDGLVAEEIDGELVVVHPGTGEAHALNGSAAAVFRLCDGKTSRTDMAAQLATQFNLPDDPQIVDLALSELVDAELVLAGQPVEGMTRRTLLRRLGMTVAAAATLPVVETMMIRPAAAQGSSPPLPPVTRPTPTPPPLPPLPPQATLPPGTS